MQSITSLYPDEAGKFLNKEQLVQFWMRVDVTGEDDCWPWIGTGNGVGYGQFRVNRKLHLSHRLAKLDVTGDHGTGFVLRHMCNNSSCCNPRHLEYGTQKQNIQDCILAGRFKAVNGKLGVAARAKTLPIPG